MIKSRGLEDSIINVGPLSQQDLGAFYKHCDALVMPTRLESFSGTYLEAMHFGMPILTSDLDFAHEVCGDAALYFNPWNAESIRDAILTLKSRPELKQDLVAKGQARLRAGFKTTWDGVARGYPDEPEGARRELLRRSSGALVMHLIRRKIGEHGVP